MNTQALPQNLLKPGLLLALVALFGTGLLVAINLHSAPYIEHNEYQLQLRAINAVLHGVEYDNDIIADSKLIQDKSYLGLNKPAAIYRARKGKQPVAAVLTVVAPNGYSGPIRLLVGINTRHSITGVRVVKHKETPGLGDAIEKRRSNWIDIFLGKSRNNPADANWKVKRDGGDFDQLTGATISPRAIVKAVHKALIYFEKHQVMLFDNDQDAAEN